MLIKNQTPQSTFNAKYKPSYQIIKKIGDRSFDVQDPSGKVKRVSARHLQFMYPAEYYMSDNTPPNGTVWENCKIQ